MNSRPRAEAMDTLLDGVPVQAKLLSGLWTAQSFRHKQKDFALSGSYRVVICWASACHPGKVLAASKAVNPGGESLCD